MRQNTDSRHERATHANPQTDGLRQEGLPVLGAERGHEETVAESEVSSEAFEAAYQTHEKVNRIDPESIVERK